MTAAPWPPGLRPPDNVPHSWRCSRPPSEDYPITDQDGRQQIVKRCPGCKFGAVNASVDGGREVAGGFGRGAIQIGGTARDCSDAKGHEDAEHQSSGRRASVRHQHLAWVDPSCSEFRDHVPRSMINESWRDVQRCRSALWNDEFVARCAQCRDDPVQCIDGSACGRERSASPT
jgi:hypothetical protein